MIIPASRRFPHSRAINAKFILPALTEATDPYWRPIKYSLFPPLGLATLATAICSATPSPSRCCWPAFPSIRCRSCSAMPASASPKSTTHRGFALARTSSKRACSRRGNSGRVPLALKADPMGSSGALSGRLTHKRVIILFPASLMTYKTVDIYARRSEYDPYTDHIADI